MLVPISNKNDTAIYCNIVSLIYIVSFVCLLAFFKFKNDGHDKKRISFLKDIFMFKWGPRSLGYTVNLRLRIFRPFESFICIQNF